MISWPNEWLAVFDITGATETSLAQGIHWLYAAASMPLLALTVLV